MNLHARPFVLLLLVLMFVVPAAPAYAQGPEPPVPSEDDLEAQFWAEDGDAESNWHPSYLGLATGNPGALPTLQEKYAWPVADGTPFTVGHVIQSYQYYGGT